MKPEIKLNVTTLGSGPDLALLHGWGIDSRIWQQVSSALAARFRIHIVDFPGYRVSPYYGPYTVSQIITLLASALPPSVCVCAWSLGGQVALQWAHDIPQQVERLVLVATTPRFIKSREWEHGMEEMVFNSFALNLARDCSSSLYRFSSLVAQGDVNAKRIVAEIRRQLYSNELPEMDSLRAGLDILAETDLRGVVNSIKQPCLLVHGDCDAITPLSAAQWLATNLPNGRLKVVTGAAHAPFLSEPQRFVKTVGDYLHG